MMRVSSGMMINKYMNQINSSYAKQAKLMEQSDGSSLHRPSDDSVKYSRYLTYQNRDTENLQYQDNVKAGTSWMKTADAAMVNMTDIYTTLKEKTVDAANDTNTDNDLITAISKEFKAKLYEMVSLGNNQQGDRYLFAGQSDLTQPFSISTEEKDRGLIKTLDDPQSRFFSNPNDTKNLNADDTGNLKQFLEINDIDGNRYFVNTQNGRMYTEEFLQQGYKDKLKEGKNYVEEGDEYAQLPFFDTDALKVSGYFENTGVVRTQGEVTFPTNNTADLSYLSELSGLDLDLPEYKDAVLTVDKDMTFKMPNTSAGGNVTYDYVEVTAGEDISGYLKKLHAYGLDAEDMLNSMAIGTGYTEETFEEADRKSELIPPMQLNASNFGTDKRTYNYGEQIDVAVGDAIKVDDVPIYIVGADGNERVVAKGNTAVIQSGEKAYMGVPLKAITYQQGKVLSLGSNSTDPEAEPVKKFNKDATYTLDKYEDAIADADVDASGIIIKAGERIPGGSVIKFLSDNTSIIRDPKKETANQTAASISALTPETNTSVIAADDITIRVDTGTTDASGNPIYSYDVLTAGAELNGRLPLNSGETMKIGNFTNDADFNAASDTTETTLTTYYHDTLFTKEMQTGEPVVFKDEDGNPVDTVTLPSADVMIKNANGDARMVKAGNPITLQDGESEAIIIGKPQTEYRYDGFTTIKQPIVTYNGDPKYISMVKLNGSVDQTADTINTTGQDLNGSNIFDDKNSGNQTQIMSNGRLCYASSGSAMINDMFTVCAKLEHGDRKWMRTDGITVADMAHEVITTTQSKTAARQNVYDNVSQMLTKQSETITEDINNVSGTDIAQLAVKLMEAQTLYNMSLSMGSKILPPSLADYL